LCAASNRSSPSTTAPEADEIVAVPSSSTVHTGVSSEPDPDVAVTDPDDASSVAPAVESVAVLDVLDVLDIASLVVEASAVVAPSLVVVAPSPVVESDEVEDEETVEVVADVGPTTVVDAVAAGTSCSSPTASDSAMRPSVVVCASPSA
jgi:hypothetical protein